MNQKNYRNTSFNEQASKAKQIIRDFGANNSATHAKHQMDGDAEFFLFNNCNASQHNCDAYHSRKHHMDATRAAADVDSFLFQNSNVSHRNGDTGHHRKYQINPERTSGGDADRVLYAYQHNGDSYRHKKDTYYPQRKSYCSPRATTLPGSPKYHQTMGASADECNLHQQYLCETESNFGAPRNGSENSAKSQISSKTVVSRKSSHELRKNVESQCKIHDMIDETLKQMCNPDDVDKNLTDAPYRLIESPSATEIPIANSQCKLCTDNLNPSHSSPKGVTAKIAKGDFLEWRNLDTLTITVDDIVNSKVINPMIRKLQRMYLNNLKEEMSLMEDLERLPHKVDEVYKATVFKQKE